MAKYDYYKAIKTALEESELDKELSVLFEDGDNIAEVIQAADAVLNEVTPGEVEPLDDQLLALNENDFRELLKRVWLVQINKKDSSAANYYRNALRGDVNVAYFGRDR